jgi:hypothetical protein
MSNIDLLAHHQDHLAPLVLKAPYILRFTEWHDQPPPVLVVKERREFLEDPAAQKQMNIPGSTKKILVEVGFLAGEAQRRLLPVLRQIVSKVRDQADIPLELQRYLSKEGLRLRLNLPLDEETGAKLGLIFKLQLRTKELDRVELMARRVATFSREEAAYWLSRTTRFSPEANRWAVSGLRIMLGGQPGDPAIATMLEKIRSI